MNSSLDLPQGRFRSQLERLPVQAQDRAVSWMQGFHFTEMDLEALQIDGSGGIYYADPFTLAPVSADSEPVVAETAVPVSPFPTSLMFHSRPGAPNVLYIDFDGEDVTGTQWNTDLGRTTIPAVAFNLDSDASTFSDTEQLAIKRIWQRMSEDYAPFNIDVTTERPATFTTRTAHALITRNTDANGAANPSSTAGGVAYVSVFATSTYAKYRPAWIYYNNLANTESYIAEAASHEIGHNMGLSHDGTTSLAYYGGHGSGDISWGPLMGTGYTRNVSQWSKGDYYLANNTEDDLAIIAAKLVYRTDDHGGTIETATLLKVTGGTNVVSTTPEDDPSCTNTYNKGCIEKNTDIDVFSFVTGSGAVNLQIKPWVSPSGTRGGNLDVAVELLDQSGCLILSNNPPTGTSAAIQTNLDEGLYYLRIRNTGAGDPMSSTPTGYSSYGSVGQYFISGTVRPSNFIIPPQATLNVADVSEPGAAQIEFSVTYTDDVGINASTLGSGNLRVTGPNGYDVSPLLISVDMPGDGTPRVATYAMQPPDGVAWRSADNGTYAVFMQTNQVADTEGAWVPAGELGTFEVNLVLRVYLANMDTNPGWTFDGSWAYGTPSYLSSGPQAGYTGSSIVGYDLSGNYDRNLPMMYATTPSIDCSGASDLTLRFYRWLGLRSGDTVSIEASIDNSSWTTLWSSSSLTSDGKWTQVQYALPAWANNAPALRLRWGISSDKTQSDIGWNLDDVEIIAGGLMDYNPPVAALSASDVLIGGSPSQSLSVTYSDDTAIRVDSIGTGDLLVTGPNSYSNIVSWVGVDDASDGTPRTAVYSVDAPGGSWGVEDNGTYSVVLLDGQVTDVSGNAVGETLLGTFNVNVQPPPVLLSVSAFPETGGTVTPLGGNFAPGSTVELTATPSPCYQFHHWEGCVSNISNPLSVTVSSNMYITACFAPMLTTNYSVPYLWLAENGFTNDPEAAVTCIGENHYSIWQSYIAGLDPNDPNSRLLLSSKTEGDSTLLEWNSVTGRVYTVLSSTSLSNDFVPVPGAEDLPWTVTGYTNAPGTNGAQFFRLEVKLP